MNRVLCLYVGILLSISSAFAVEWVKESAAFEFPGTSVKYQTLNAKALHFSTVQLPGKKLMKINYTLPVNSPNAVINIYSINGAKVSSLKLNNKSTSITWDIARRGAGTYTAELKTETAKKTIRFVIAH